MADDSDEDYNPHEDQENFNRSTSPMKAAISHPAAKPTKKKAKKETKVRGRALHLGIFQT